MTEHELQQTRAKALADGDQAALYEADRELAAIAEYAEHYRRLTRRMLDDPTPRHR